MEHFHPSSIRAGAVVCDAGESPGQEMASCKLSVSCADDAQVRATRPTYASRYGTGSDAKFLKSVAEKRRQEGGGDGSTPARKVSHGSQPEVVDSYSCRQMYLRSYVFARRESLPERMRLYAGAVRETAGDLPLLRKRRSGGSVDGSVCGHGYVDGSTRSRTDVSYGGDEHAQGGEKAKGKKRCLRGAWLWLHRLLSCTTKVDVVNVTRFPLLSSV